MHRILTILYKTQNTLNNSLFNTPQIAFWSDILTHTFQSLSTRPQRPARIVGEHSRRSPHDSSTLI